MVTTRPKPHAGSRLAASTMGSTTGSTTVVTSQNHPYDVVKVDLEDGRDYPIYIGTDYSDEEGM